jgi:hypothetical protein
MDDLNEFIHSLEIRNDLSEQAFLRWLGSEDEQAEDCAQQLSKHISADATSSAYVSNDIQLQASGSSGCFQGRPAETHLRHVHTAAADKKERLRTKNRLAQQRFREKQKVFSLLLSTNNM